MTTGAFIVARLSSSRLPNKNIKPIAGMPMIEHLHRRLSPAKTLDKVVITTTVEPSDDPLVALAKKNGFDHYRGPLDLIMERIVGAAEAHKCDTIVEILGDNPFMHHELVDDVVAFHRKGGYDYSATATSEYAQHRDHPEWKLFSLGVRVQVYSLDAARAHADYPEYYNSDKHPSSYIFEHPERFKLGFFFAEGKWSFMNRPELLFAVNTEGQFNAVRDVFEKFCPAKPQFTLREIYDAVDEKEFLVKKS